VRRDTKIVGAVIAAIALSILSSAMACTWAIAHGASMRWRLLFRLFCHGIERRCLTIWSVPMPICARCTAIYVGLFAGIAVFMLLPKIGEELARKLAFAAAIPMLIDGLTQLTTLRESTNALRMATGVLAGIAFTFWALTAVERPPLQLLDDA
jgi:uncharacterized membrane protein